MAEAKGADQPLGRFNDAFGASRSMLAMDSVPIVRPALTMESRRVNNAVSESDPSIVTFSSPR